MNLKNYIKGERHGEEANRLEREAMKDPFLQGAIDGYDSVEGDHYSVIQKLEQQLTRPRKRVNKRVWIAAAAALLLLLIGIPFLLHPPQQMAEPLVATTDTRVEKEIVKERTAEEETVEEKTVEEEAVEKSAVEEKTVEESSVDGKIEPLEEVVVAQAVETTKEQELLETAQATETTVTTKTAEEHVALETAQATERIETTRATGRVKVTEEAAHEYESVPALALMQQPSRNAAIDTAKKRGADDMVLTAFGSQKKEEMTGPAGTMKKPTTRVDAQAINQLFKREVEGTEVKGTGAKAFGELKSFTKESGKKDAEAEAVEVKGVKTEGFEAVEFGEKEFREYFIKHYDKTLCQGDSITFTVSFSIGSDGRPTVIRVQENNCPDLETEIKRLLLGSPPWTNTNRTVTLTVEIP